MGLLKYVFRKPLVSEFIWTLSERLEPKRPLASQIECLRTYLRRCPTWIAGHERLGYAALDFVEFAERDEIPRLLATVEISAKAIETFLRTNPSSESSLRHGSALRILASGVAFYRQDHETALRYAEQILASSQAELGSIRKRKLFEQAGASALALGLDDKAQSLFAAIPDEHRTAQANAALSYIEKKDAI